MDNPYDAAEAKDIRLFNEFRSTATSGSTFWKEAYATDKYTSFDVVSITSTNVLVYNELKYRTEGTDKYPTAFIEVEKYRKNMRYYLNCGILPLYVNFVGGTNNVYVWFLPDINVTTHVPEWRQIKNVDGTPKWDLYFGIDWGQAWHWVNGKLVAKPKRINKKPTKELADFFEGCLEEFVKTGQYKNIDCSIITE